MTDGYYRCDRCGRYEKGPIHRSRVAGMSRDFSDEAYRRISYGHATGEENTGSISKNIDLCHECRKALTEWLQEDVEAGEDLEARDE